MFLKFFRDTVLFSVIYLFAMTFVIIFYHMTAEGTEVVYPVLMAVFFYVLYMSMRFISYKKHYTDLKRLGMNSVNVKSVINEYQHAYDEIYKIYKRYGDENADISQKATEEKRFISAYIHNLKTPVTVSSIIIQRVENGELEPLDGIREIASELSRLNENLNSFLELQRLSEMQNDYEPQALNLMDELQRIINVNKSLFINSKVYPKILYDSGTDRGAEIETAGKTKRKTEREVTGYTGEEDEDKEKTATNACTIGYSRKIPVYTDKKWNEVLISQIISNAVKYSKNGTDTEEAKHIFFSIKQCGEHTELIIKDEGMGVPKYDIPKVFDAFFTGENGRKIQGSSGIGLYLCKQICEHLGHGIELENDNGCKVKITYLSKL